MPKTPDVTPPERPRGKVLREVAETVERLSANHKALRDDPKVKEMTAMLMTGRASELLDIIEEVERRIPWAKKTNHRPDVAVAVLEDLLSWLKARDENMAQKSKER